MKTLDEAQQVQITLQRAGTENRIKSVLITVKFLPSQFQGEKAHSNPVWDSQPGENGYQSWSVHGVKVVKAASLKRVVETASSVEPVNESESVVRIVVTPKSCAIRLKRGERNMLRSLVDRKPVSIHNGVNLTNRETQGTKILPANRQIPKPQKNGHWERVKPIFSLEKVDYRAANQAHGISGKDCTRSKRSVVMTDIR
ncbi:hypothetical protein [Nostoc sp.]|uniref:hypothetical protein n=1 Tax=Nostoc sp. TaxID=1180 RepID=UPI002FF4B65D